MKYKIMVVKQLVSNEEVQIIDPKKDYTLEEIQAFKKGVEEIQKETSVHGFKCYIIVEGDE